MSSRINEEEKKKKVSIWEKEFLGIEFKRWLIAIICWILMGICMYLMFIFSPIEIDLVLSILSTLFGLASILSLSTTLTRSEFRKFVNEFHEFRKEVAYLLQEILNELRRSRERS